VPAAGTNVLLFPSQVFSVPGDLGLVCCSRHTLLVIIFKSIVFALLRWKSQLI
jgi:hypothetical protein